MKNDYMKSHKNFETKVSLASIERLRSNFILKMFLKVLRADAFKIEQ